MTPADWFLGAMMVQCAVASGCYFQQGNYPFGLAFIGYTVANFGLLLASMK